MLKLCKIPTFPGWNVPSISMASAKLETWLRMAGIPYELIAWPPLPPAQAPKGKFPFIDDNGLVIGDSTLILDHLKRTRGVDPDAPLTHTERAIGTAFRRMLKENFYWGLFQARWGDEEGYRRTKPLWVSIWQEFLPKLGVPAEKAGEAIDGYRKSMSDQMLGHGMGRHTAEEIYQICSEDLISVSDFLGDKPFFFGEHPVGVDATIYGYITNTIDVPLDDPLAHLARSRQNLVDYCRRMRTRFFGDSLQA